MIRRNFITGSLASLAAFFGLGKAVTAESGISSNVREWKRYTPGSVADFQDWPKLGTVIDVPLGVTYEPPPWGDFKYFCDLSYKVDGEEVKKVGGFQTLEEMIAFMKATGPTGDRFVESMLKGQEKLHGQ
jgi:hypothetical protein